jgi:hypothetical protein
MLRCMTSRPAIPASSQAVDNGSSRNEAAQEVVNAAASVAFKCDNIRLLQSEAVTSLQSSQDPACVTFDGLFCIIEA